MLSRRSFLWGFAQGVKMFGDAELYEGFMGRWSRLAAPLFVNFTGIPESGRVLDVGSGTGSLAFSIARQSTQSQVVGIDPAREYVKFATSRNPFPDRVTFETGDAQKMRFPTASFESSLSLLVFNFIPDAKKALGEVRRVTKPGGRISAAVWDYGEGMRMLRFFFDAAVSVDREAEKIDEKHMPLCRAGELGQLWTQGGLEKVHEQALNITMRFESFADYWDPFLRGQGPSGAYVRSLDQDRRQALRAELKRRLDVSAEDKAFTLPARLWAVRGEVPLNF